MVPINSVSINNSAQYSYEQNRQTCVRIERGFESFANEYWGSSFSPEELNNLWRELRRYKCLFLENPSVANKYQEALDYMISDINERGINIENPPSVQECPTISCGLARFDSVNKVTQFVANNSSLGAGVTNEVKDQNGC